MLCALLMAVLAQEPRINGPDLLKTGRLVSATEDWSGYILHTACYEWVSDNELIYYTKRPSHRDLDWWIHLLDVNTGISKRLEPLTDLYNEELAGVGGLHPSPDRRYFWSTRHGDPPQFYVTDIEGRELGAWTIHRTGSRWDPCRWI